jgi:FixJ family two-component response regulator
LAERPIAVVSPIERLARVVSAIGESVTAFDDGRSRASESLEGPWVGIVDDDAALRRALARVLRGNGIRAETFGSAEDFLACAMTSEPACIVVDIHLGGMSGFDLQDALSSRPAAPPIIFITAHDMLSHRAQASSASGFLRKPFDTNVLVALLRPHLCSRTPG